MLHYAAETRRRNVSICVEGGSKNGSKGLKTVDNVDGGGLKLGEWVV